METLAKKLPSGIGFEWTGLSYQERLSGAQAPALYALSLLVVFLCLAALYESWTIPVSVMLVIPLGILGALIAATLRGLYDDIYFQVGLLTTMGLSAKNAILIVEFAVSAEKAGATPLAAAMEAAKLRLRPILMTSLAFVAGVFPLAIATSAGAGGQNDIGTGVIGGMLGATILTIFFVPIFFILVRGLLKWRSTPPCPLRRLLDMMTPKSIVATVGVALLLGGCATLEPAYQRPALPTPAEFPQAEAADVSVTGRVASDTDWRSFFIDPKLRAVIKLGLANNRDLRVAVANIEAARAQYRVQRADLVPHLNASFGATYGREPLSAVTGEGSSAGDIDEHQYSASGGFSSYELDLFGRIRSLTKSALEQYLATEEARRAAQISVVSEVASDYLTVASDEAILQVAKDSLASANASLDITQKRFAHGVASQLDVRQAQSLVEQDRADMADDTTLVAQDGNALQLAVGSPIPDSLAPQPLGGDPLVLNHLPAGLASDVLITRPDVLEAEHQLKSQNAQIGAARAAFFPSITLTGSDGATSVSLSSLFKGPSAP